MGPFIFAKGSQILEKNFTEKMMREI